MTCKNCGNTIHVKYCSYCGQEPIKGRLSIKEFMQKFAEAFTHADTSVFTLVKHLSRRPAGVSREYIEGKRKKYYSPMKYLVLVVTLSALLTLHYEKYEVPFEPVFGAESDVDEMVEHKYFNHNYYRYLLFLSIPLASLVTWLVFRKSGLNFSENLVINTYLLAQVILLHTIFVTPMVIYSSSLDDWIILTYMVLAVAYILWSYTSFFGGKWWVTLTQSVIALALFTLSYNLISHSLYLLLGKK